MKGTWERIDLPSIPRTSHSLDIVYGSAYMFGGEAISREPVDNKMHIVRLPFSSAGADYHKIKANAAVKDVPETEFSKSGSAEGEDEVPLDSPEFPETRDKGKGKELATDDTLLLSDVPEARVGHATAVIGARIFLFGGRGGADMNCLDEGGRVWVFDTRSNAWSYLDPVPAVKGGAIVPHPAPRSHHCATSTNRPSDFARAPAKKAETWREWALGDTSKTGIPQDPIVGHVAEDAVDEESDGYGTFFVHAGCLNSGDRTSDLWAFDVRSRTWTELPAAPGPSREGTSLCISKSRLYRFGGFDGEQELGGQLDFLHLEVEMFDDNVSRGEVCIRARGSWQTIMEDNLDASSTEIHVEAQQVWPEARSAASLHALTIGGGREYLVLSMGEQPSLGKLLDDVWMFQVPPQGMTAASFTSAVLQAVGRKTGEGEWIKVSMGLYDEDIDETPARRSRLASALMTDVEESGIVFWGGLGETSGRLGDGWILRLG